MAVEFHKPTRCANGGHVFLTGSLDGVPFSLTTTLTELRRAREARADLGERHHRALRMAQLIVQQDDPRTAREVEQAFDGRRVEED